MTEIARGAYFVYLKFSTASEVPTGMLRHLGPSSRRMDGGGYLSLGRVGGPWVASWHLLS